MDVLTAVLPDNRVLFSAETKGVIKPWKDMEGS